MAYAAVTSLLRTLDYLLPFPSLIFEFIHAEARQFLNMVQEVPSYELIADDFPRYSPWLFSGSNINPRAVCRLSRTQIKMLLNNKTLRSVEKNPPILHELREAKALFKAEITAFTAEAEARFRAEITASAGQQCRPTAEITASTAEAESAVPSALALAPAPTLKEEDQPTIDAAAEILHRYRYQGAEKLLLVCRKLTDGIRRFNSLRAGVAFLRRDLLFLLPQLDDSSIKWDDRGLLNCIRDLSDRVRHLIEESMVDKQIEKAMSRFIERVFQMNFPLVILKEDHIENVIANLFCGYHGIQKILLLTLKQSRTIKVLTLALRRTGKDVIAEISSPESQRNSTNEETVVGLDDEQLKIILTRMPSRLEILTIVGMGGIGKTTLARKLFNDPYAVHEFDCRAWIRISQVCQLRDLLLGLLTSVVERSHKISEKSDDQLAEDLKHSLKHKRYLIVLDDVWSIDTWKILKECFPDDNIGSRIIVTSRSKEIADAVSPNKQPHLMKFLDKEKSWELLEKLVFGIASCPPELVEVGKQIAKRCGGLPLAIVVIAGVLSSNIKVPNAWKHIAENPTMSTDPKHIAENPTMSTDPKQWLDILALSYIYLPHHLRSCFLYIAAFPEDCKIEAQKLVNLWVAEGFIFSDGRNTLEQIAEKYLEELIGRNLVLVEKRSCGGKVKSCRLHDFIRELCLREAPKENFMSVVQMHGSKHFPAGMRNELRLSFHLDPYGDVPAAPRLSQVSSFLCFTLGSSIIPDILIIQLGFKLLSILDIYFLHLEGFPEQILSLIHLRYLGLNVTFELPATMSQLRNLQTFNMQGPWSSQESSSSPELLLEYWSMPSLGYLQTSVASRLRIPPVNPPGLFAPENLQTLSKITYSSCRQEIFTFMSHLKRLRICETEEDYKSDRSCGLLKNLDSLQELETLECCFYQQTLEARHLSCLDAFPSTLRQLSLSWSYLPWEDMTAIAKLPNLEVLKLKNYAFQGPKWVPAEVGFPSLKYLLIAKTNLVLWGATVDQYPCLQQLILKSCKHLEEIPFGVEDIGTLQHLEVHYCSEPIEILGREIQEQGDGVDVVLRSDRATDSA